MEKLNIRHLSSVLNDSEEWVMLEGHSLHEFVYYNRTRYNRYYLDNYFSIRYYGEIKH